MLTFLGTARDGARERRRRKRFLWVRTMLRRQFIWLLSGKAAVVLGFGLAGCTYPGDYAPATIYPYPGPYYDYYYYPGVNVYFHIHTGFYYYHHGGAWHHSRSLPGHIHLNRSHRRRIHIRERRPYDRNREHRRQHERPDAERGARRDGEAPEGRTPEPLSLIHI